MIPNGFSSCEHSRNHYSERQTDRVHEGAVSDSTNGSGRDLRTRAGGQSLIVSVTVHYGIIKEGTAGTHQQVEGKLEGPPG